MTYQESILKNVLTPVGVLHGIADMNMLARALETTHPENRYSFVKEEGTNNLVLTYDCYDFQYKYLLVVNDNGYVKEIHLL